MDSNNSAAMADVEASVQSYSDVLRAYYTGGEFVMSTEGILKFISIVLSLLASMLFMAGGVCSSSSRWLVPVFPVALIVSGILIAATYIGTIMRVGRYLPEAWLYFDIVLSTTVGILMLVMAILTMTMCSNNSFLDYLPGPVAILTSVLVIISTVVTFIASTIRWDKIDKTNIQPTTAQTRRSFEL